MNKSTPSLLYAACGLTAIVSILAIYVWGHSFGWNTHVLNSYLFFPVLGLLAFSIMWSQYILGFVQRITGASVDLARYFQYTGYAVLLLIVLHPGILIYQRFRDGFGLPPGSYESYVAPGRGWVTLLGTVSLLIFLAFELRRLYGQKSWWKYVARAGDVAMLLIFYHSLRLGTQLQSGWFRFVWYFYGVTLIAVLLYNYTYARQPKTAA